jgi:hypothetical protein
MMVLRWNSRHGYCYVDGSFFKHPLELGDQIKIDGTAPALKLFDRNSVVDSCSEDSLIS